MKFMKSFLYYSAIILMIIAVLSPEVEARRKILRGRKTITRTYYRSTGIPAWSIILLCGFGMVVLGGALYAVLRKVILDSEPNNSYSPPPMQHEA